MHVASSTNRPFGLSIELTLPVSREHSTSLEIDPGILIQIALYQGTTLVGRNMRHSRALALRALNEVPEIPHLQVE